MTELCEKPDFERVYADFKGKVSRYVHGKIANVHDAEDVVSDVFVKVLNRLSEFDGSRASLSTWIYTITRNTVTDYFRTSKQFCGLSEELICSNDIDEIALEEETLEQLAKALEMLSERLRDIIVLHYYCGETLKSIAVKMGISYSYIKLLHANALSALQKNMNEG